QGKSGFAHLFEHMMFQGSENVAKSEHMKLVADVGGTMNGSTSKDRTNYYEVMPENQLELALWLEADRMRSLALTQENFENQRDTVKEERKSHVDNAPYGLAFLMLDDLAYENWAYKHSIIGSMEDLDNADLEDVVHFHNRFYHPGNAILAIVGDMDILSTLELVRKHFEDIPGGETPPVVNLQEPLQHEEKRRHWYDAFAPLPAWMCAYHVPQKGTDEHYALELAEKILFDGESSRMYRRLVQEEQLVVHLYGGLDGKHGPGTMIMFAQLKPGVEAAQVEAVIAEEVEKLLREPISERELQKIKNQFKMEFASKLEKVYYKSEMLCHYTMMFDDPGLINKEIERYDSISEADVKNAIAKWIKPTNRSVVEVYPATEKTKNEYVPNI
ncbi:MAG: pitrilysin family protein, partial [Calditrichota bacterium]